MEIKEKEYGSYNRRTKKADTEWRTPSVRTEKNLKADV